MGIREKALEMKAVSPFMAAVSEEQRNQALQAIADAITAHREEIRKANEEDLKQAEEKGVSAPILKRLKFGDDKIADVISGIGQLIDLPDPLHRTTLHRQMDEGLILRRETCPIGVVGVIFEARPDAMVQVSTLCLKSGNCAILKGGSEAGNTNRTLFRIIHDAALEAGLPEGCMLLAESHEDVDDLLGCYGAIDLLIPRGSNEFVQHIMNHTRIPVMGHADGICHIYVDQAADIDKSIPVILDAKTQYVAACNAVETLLVHRAVAERLMPALQDAFRENHVTLRGTDAIRAITDCEPASDDDFETEYLDYIISAKIVDDIEEAITHINRYGSHHTDAILTEDDAAAEHFMNLVDSAGVYRNCSTRFADGFRYGFGAEVGISTSKLHARGPVGLDGLVTYKYKIYGNGQIVGDYASGKRTFQFKEL